MLKGKSDKGTQGWGDFVHGKVEAFERRRLLTNAEHWLPFPKHKFTTLLVFETRLD